MLEFHGNKWVTVLPRFHYFRNLSDYNWKLESVNKTTNYRERKATLSKMKGFFSNAAWFCDKYNINKIKHNYLYMMYNFFTIVAKPIVLTHSFF